MDKAAIVEINRIITSHYGQPHFLMSEANLDHALARMQKYGEEIDEADERLFRKAAYLLYHLTYDMHVFSDGNKRSALSAAAAFLSANGYSMKVEGDAAQEKQAALMKGTAEGKCSVSHLCKWLRKVSFRA
ncbi:MAG: Fic family protein [Candidatus Micrarchaeia archaeon]